MKSGTQKLYVYANDISGGPLQVSGGWDVVGVVGENEISSVSVIPLSGEAIGFHECTVGLPVGIGFVKIYNTDTDVMVTPTYHDIDTTVYTADDVYGRFLASTGIRLASNLLNYSFTTVANDDFYETITVDAPISAYGGDGATISGWSFIFASDTPAISGSAFVADDIQRIINLSIPKESLPESLLNDAASVTINFHVQGTSPSGKVKTVAQIALKILEDFTDG